MATNEILKFGDDASNILGQSAYAADTDRTEGVSGKARSNLQNKFQRQMSVAAAGLSQFIADYNSGDDNVVDTLSAVEYAALLLDALSNAPLTTQSQFDDSQKVATTEFVQRSLGSFSNVTSLSASTVLSASYVGKVIYAAASSINIALPHLADVPTGSQITICANGYTDIFIDSQSPDLIANGELGTALTAVSISGWEAITLVKSSTPKWFVSFGDAALSGSSLFKRGLTGNGYQKLPGGLIIQWGKQIIPAAPTTINFPISFPTSCLIVVATDYGAGSLSVSATSQTISSFSAIARDKSLPAGGVYQGCDYNWFAVGF